MLYSANVCLLGVACYTVPLNSQIGHLRPLLVKRQIKYLSMSVTEIFRYPRHIYRNTEINGTLLE